jgi:Glyoxalase-like domain
MTVSRLIERPVGAQWRWRFVREHDDLHVERDLDAEVRRLEELGERRASAEVVEIGPVSLVAMSDPEGNEFCVVLP